MQRHRGSMRGWFVAAGMVLLNVAAGAQTPALPAIETAPPSVPYHWRNVAIHGGGFVSGIVFSPSQKGLVYARTDVGGAYRSDDAGETWIPLTDQFGRDESTYLGIESIALDPQDGGKLYLAAGMYSADWGGPSAIFRSNDRGRTFEKTPMPFRMGGNDNGRGVGERLAVDPNFGSVLFFGSRKAGLWKSADAGVTWSHVESFPAPAKLTGPGENTGITFVLFDPASGAKGKRSSVVYAGVALVGSSLYRSEDAGLTWTLVPGAPKDLFPSHAAFNRNGVMYVTYVDNVGPNGITDGAVWKYIEGKWKDVTPLSPRLPEAGRFGYGGLGLDAQRPDTLMVTTIDRWGRDTIFRSRDGGKSWKDVRGNAQFSATTTPWVYWHKDTTGGTGWMSDIKIDPFDSGKTMYTTGEGIWGSANVTAADAGRPTFWGFPDVGLEETVPLSIVSPPQGAHLISGVGDIGGFRHEDVEKSPAGGFFIDPQLSNNNSVDFAALAPMIVVRVGQGDNKTARGGYSTDNAVSWKPLGGEPPSSRHGGGAVAISADGKIVVWSPEKGEPYWSSDWGHRWSACGGLNDRMRVVSDRLNPLKFYSFNAETGQLLVSVDGAKTFVPRQEPVAPRDNSLAIAANPGKEGDLWIAAGQGLYHSADSGMSFVVLEGMSKVSRLGFGMAAPGKSSPVIYVSGVAAGVEGMFRSDDAGQSWVRIDDPAHQFGWKNAVIGDPRIYGRVYLATGGRGIVFGDPVPARR